MSEITVLEINACSLKFFQGLLYSPVYLLMKRTNEKVESASKH